MSVPVGVGTFSKYFNILFIRKIFPEKPVGCVERFSAYNVNHNVSLRCKNSTKMEIVTRWHFGDTEIRKLNQTFYAFSAYPK